ncbi:MAG: hypothetical protein MI739_03325 [Bacteroidales bacterium]|nr:hypothetical protein [Bacteroidales bacterium]
MTLFQITSDPVFIVNVLTLIVVTTGLLSLVFQRKGIHFSTVQKCINDHRDILRNQQKAKIAEKDKSEHLILIRDHLGLITEELFYMKKGYLPKDLAKSWLRHMIEFIPIKSDNDKDIELNKTRIKTSREVSPFLETTNNGDITQNYNEYIKLVSDTTSFVQINKAFKLRSNQLKKLKLNGDELIYTEKNVAKLVGFIWDNNVKK